MARTKVRASNAPDDALGSASHGGWAYVFASRVLMLSVSAHACFPRVLGSVIAHEIGHVLLPEHSHAPQGIMQESLQPLDGTNRYFTAAHAAMLRNVSIAGRRLAE
jgi:hypothetical protein